MRRLAIVSACVVCALAVGCGSSDKGKSTGSKTPAGGPAPAALLGTYETTLSKQDLASNKAPVFSDAGAKWKLKIASSGGPDNGRYMSIISKAQGELETFTFGVSGSTIALKREECETQAGVKFYDNEYRFAQNGKTLRFTKVRNSCPDRIAETILTSEPWKKTKGG